VADTDPKKPALTLIAVPEDGGRVRRVQFSRRALNLALVGLGVLFIAVSLMVMDYVAAKFEVVHLNHRVGQSHDANAKLLEANKYQEAQIEALAGKVAGIRKKLDRMDEIDTSIRRMTRLNPEDESGAAPAAMGGDAEPELGTNFGLGGKGQLESFHAILDRLDQSADTRVASLQSLQKDLSSYTGTLVSVPSIWPVRGWVSSEFGYRISPFTGERAFHQGIDVATPEGMPIIAPANGMIEFVGVQGNYGNTLVIRHGAGLSTLFGHLQAALVAEGQMVRRGQQIALVGNTGRSTGPHVHYEVRQGGVPIDPRHYILY
jgi:murein DD-endopeptidase MepM/ murein hydrolase activator NlpD